MRAFAAQAPEPTWLVDYTLAQSALLATVAAQTPLVLLLAYFLLASGEHFRRKLVQLVGPSLSRKKDAVRILEEIDVQIDCCSACRWWLSPRWCSIGSNR